MATSRTASVFQLGVRFQDGTLQTTAAFGTVTSVAMTGDGVIFNATVGGSPITVAGTLVPALLTQTANRILAGPTSGGAATPTFRALVTADLPAGTGTVTNFTAGNLSPLFTTNVATSTTTPALTFTLTNQSANLVFAGPSTGSAAAPTFRSLVAADIPALAYVTSVALTVPSIFSISGSPITSSGTLAIDLQTQTANTVWAGPTSGGAATPTFRALVAADISGLVSTAWSAITNAAGALTLANAGNATTFNQTSAVVWTWANSVTATSGGTVSPSPILKLGSRIFSSGVDSASTWTIQNALNPSTALSFTITNASENASNQITLTIGAHTLAVGNWVTVSGVSTAAFTYMNTLNGRITSVAATTITFLDSSSHGTQGSAACNGTVTQIPTNELTFVAAGSGGDSRLMLPAGAPAVGYGGTFGFTGNSAWHGFGMTSTAINPAFFISTRGGSGDSFLLFYSDGNGTKSPTQRGGISLGDNSAGNSVLALSTAVSNNFSVALLAGYNTGVTQPAVMLGNNNNFTATANNQTCIGLGFSTGSTTAAVFAPTSGTATFQAVKLKYSINQTGGANGAVTGFLISAVETAVGGTHLMLDLQAGSAGTTSVLAINNSGVVTKYASTTLVSQGMPSEIVTVDLTAQTAAIAATTLISAPRSGMYRISWSADITTAATTSSILGGTNGFQVVFTSPTDSVVKTTVAGNSVTSAANTTGTAVGGSIVVYAKTGTNIQYSFDYTSVGGTPMAYELHIKVEAL